ncbi:LacI family DNA-binding transcriptional regulator, partial [Actinocorallia lasiicapitis]
GSVAGTYALTGKAVVLAVVPAQVLAAWLLAVACRTPLRRGRFIPEQRENTMISGVYGVFGRSTNVWRIDVGAALGGLALLAILVPYTLNTDHPLPLPSNALTALAGVSQPTVSRALRGDRTVSSATRMRIEAIARQLNYKVDKNASSLRRGQSMTLALLFFEDPLDDGSFITPFFLSMLGSILRTCAARGYDLLTSFQQLSADWHTDYEDSRKADGIILLGYGDYELYKARLEALVAQGTHFV